MFETYNKNEKTLLPKIDFAPPNLKLATCLCHCMNCTDVALRVVLLSCFNALPDTFAVMNSALS